MSQKKDDWLSLMVAIIGIGLIGGLATLMRGDHSFSSGFFGSLRAFTIAISILIAHVGIGGAIGYLLGKIYGNKDTWSTGGAVVGLILFVLYAAA